MLTHVCFLCLWLRLRFRLDYRSRSLGDLLDHTFKLKGDFPILILQNNYSPGVNVVSPQQEGTCCIGKLLLSPGFHFQDSCAVVSRCKWSDETHQGGCWQCDGCEVDIGQSGTATCMFFSNNLDFIYNIYLYINIYIYIIFMYNIVCW